MEKDHRFGPELASLESSCRVLAKRAAVSNDLDDLSASGLGTAKGEGCKGVF